MRRVFRFLRPLAASIVATLVSTAAASAAPPISARPSAVHTAPSTGAVTRMKMNDAPQTAASANSRP